MAPDVAQCEAWGRGAEEFVEMLPALLGAGGFRIYAWDAPARSWKP
jgi:hypothetical protein